MTRVLLAGGSGQLGGALLRASWPAGTRLFAPARSELDLADPTAIGRALETSGAQAIVNAAAYTAVDRAEVEAAAAFHANARIPAALAEAAVRAGLPLAHVSTDYVFDGTLGRPYETDDALAPVNVYGASKAAGELAVRSIQPRSAIVRTSWLLSPDGANFATTMLRLARERDTVRVVADQKGRPTIASDLAIALVDVILALVRDEAAPAGVFHVTNEGEADWAELAAEIFAEAGALGAKTPAIERIATKDYPTPARRPRDSRLSTARAASDYGLGLPHWRDRLPDLVRAILARH